MRILNRFSVWLAIAGVMLAVWTILTAGKQTPMPAPLVDPPRSPYDSTVAATGIIEAVNENVRIGPPAAGLVTKVFVAVGDRVGEAAVRAGYGPTIRAVNTVSLVEKNEIACWYTRSLACVVCISRAITTSEVE